LVIYQKSNMYIDMKTIASNLPDNIKIGTHKFKRVSQRLAIKISRALSPIENNGTKFGEAEMDAALIFRKMIKDPDSELLISPLSNKKYIKNDSKRLLLILTGYELTIINHVFSYNIDISQKTNISLNGSFEVEIENRRMAMEKSFRENVKHSLKTIMIKLNEQI
jgi:hypothetical protein